MSSLIWKSVLVVAVIAGCAFMLGVKGLRPGIDLAGGTSLIYEVSIPDDAPVSDQEVVESTISIQKERVDPGGIRNLEWTELAGNRIQVQMTRASDEVRAQRQAYLDARDAVLAKSIDPREVDSRLTLEEPQRTQQLVALASGDPALEEELRVLIERYEATQALQEPYTQALASLEQAQQSQGAESQAFRDALAEVERTGRALNQARAALEASRQAVLANRINPAELDRVLDLSDQADINQISARDEAFARLRDKYPQRTGELDDLLAKYETYESVKGPLDDPQDLITLLRGSGKLEFRIAASPQNPPPDLADYYERLAEAGPRSGTTQPYRWFELDDIRQFFETPEERDELAANPREAFLPREMIGAEYSGSYYVLLANTPDLAMVSDSTNPWELRSVTRAGDELGRPAVGFKTDARGASQMGRVTGNNVGRIMAVLLDGKIVTAPRINSKLPGSGIITGDFAPQELDYMIRKMRAGSPMGKMSEDPISIQTTGPELGQDNIESGLTASVLSLIVVAVFMLLYYFFPGLVADFALAANMVIILGVMAIFEAVFTLPGIAGIVLTIGMAVDANVLIFERIREELERGADLKAAVRLGYEKAFSTIVDANLTTGITCLVLYYTATPEIKGFAVTLGVGILATMFTALFMTRVIMDWYLLLVKPKSLPVLPSTIKAVGRFLSPDVDWLALRRYFFPLSAILMVLGVGMLYARGEDLLDIEFRSGTQVGFELKEGETLPIGEVRERLRDYEGNAVPAEQRALLADAEVVTTGDLTDGEAHGFTIATLIQDPKAVSDAVKEAFSDVLETTRPLTFAGIDVDAVGQAPVVPVLDEQLADVLRELPEAYRIDRLPEGRTIQGDLGGVAIVLEEIEPAASVADIEGRISRMRQQPGFEGLGYREVQVIGLDLADRAADAAPGSADQFTSAVVLVRDESTNYRDTPAAFEDTSGLAATEWELVRQAMQRDTSLASVTSFSSQVSSTMQQQALAALGLSLLAVVAYIWLRFGSIRYGLSAIIALVHDVTITLGILAICGWVYDNFAGHLLLLVPFKIDLTIVAAVLTIVGYSLNDTIVVFDRIRENRGRLAAATPAIINDSINQTISRTVLTSGTTLLSVFILYMFGGPGVHGFAFAMLVGILVGTYSSIAVASPMLVLLRGHRESLRDEDRHPTASGSATPATT